MASGITEIHAGVKVVGILASVSLVQEVAPTPTSHLLQPFAVFPQRVASIRRSDLIPDALTTRAVLVVGAKDDGNYINVASLILAG